MMTSNSSNADIPSINRDKITIALIQNKVTTDQDANLQKTLALAKRAAEKGAKIICLQELYRTIYFPQYENLNSDDYAETIPGISTAAFSELAQQYQVVIIVPIFEKFKNIKNKYYNSAVVIDAGGKILDTYHKIHVPQDPYFYEENYFAAGGGAVQAQQGYKVYKTAYATFAVLICYDQWFPEAARIAALQGADIIFYPTAIGNIVNYDSPDGDWHNAWETVMRGHAIANAVHVAAVNRVGVEDNLNFWGQSFVCDAFGKVLQRASALQEEMVVCDVDLAHNARIREGWGFLRHRRPDTYRQLSALGK